MKLIHKFKSHNFDERKSSKIYFIIIHYTALKSISESIKYLCSKKNKVSTHYIISKQGSIYSLVPEKYSAWHAGKSYWNGIRDINSHSIGIELDYFPEKKNLKYSKKLLYSLIELLKIIKKKYNIKNENILGHSDIAPYRKIDPGRNFSWYLLEKNHLAFKILQLKIKKKLLIRRWLLKNKFLSEKKKILFMLNFIGYDISLALIDKINYNLLMLNYTNRYQNFEGNKIKRQHTYQIIELHFLNILLTKLKK